MTGLELAAAPLVLLGHAALWVGRYNQLHATGLPKWVVRVGSLFCQFKLVAGAAVLTAWKWPGIHWYSPLANVLEPLLYLYALVCIVIAVRVLIDWSRRTFGAACPLLASNHTTTVDLAEQLGHIPAGDWRTKILARVPFNQALQLQVHEKTLHLPRLPAALDGLSIVQLSDLHCCRNWERPFFDEIVRQANQLDGDLVVISGDLFDHRSRLDWIEQTLAKLRGRLGTYFILGNHDFYLKRVDETRRRMSDAGMIDLGGRWIELAARGERLLLAGNELPWLPPAADMKGAPPRDEAPFRLLVAHTPDQIDWARRHDFDLMLAGHTHGGQIRFPIIGPIVAPSRLGVRRAGGIYYEPPTLLHVSRGLSGELALRINCPPELSRLELRRATIG